MLQPLYAGTEIMALSSCFSQYPISSASSSVTRAPVMPDRRGTAGGFNCSAAILSCHAFARLASEGPCVLRHACCARRAAASSSVKMPARHAAAQAPAPQPKSRRGYAPFLKQPGKGILDSKKSGKLLSGSKPLPGSGVDTGRVRIDIAARIAAGQTGKNAAAPVKMLLKYRLGFIHAAGHMLVAARSRKDKHR